MPGELMTNEPLLKATELAWRWHGTQTRKGKTAPYMSHLLQVQGLVLEHGGSDEQAIAALLHDALEDAESPAERSHRETEIETRFGSQVLRIVLVCTDTTVHEAGENKGPWRDRKERYLAQLAAAAKDSLLVAACDKRHNLGDLIGDLHQEGISTFARFNAGPAEQLWYFETLDSIFSTRIPDRLAIDLSMLVKELRSLIPASVAPDAKSKHETARSPHER
jgi:(p)ppGpp synthase/HD superfamily hydrolase